MRVLIVGMGGVGLRHYRNLKELGFDSVEGVECSVARRKVLSREVPELIVFADLESALRNEYQAAVIATPTYLHDELTAKLVKAGLHVYLEKPISHSAASMPSILEDAKSRGLLILVGYMYRFWPPLLEVKKLLEAGKVGTVYSVQATFSQYLPHWPHCDDYRKSFVASSDLGGGVLLEESHVIDFLRWMFGEVASVFCISGKISHLEMSAEDFAEMVITFESGVIGSVHLDLFGREHRKTLTVIGELGNVYWDFHTNEVRYYLASENTEYNDVTWHIVRFNCDRNVMYASAMEHFVRCIRERCDSVISGESALKSLDVVVAAKRSSVLGSSQSPGNC